MTAFRWQAWLAALAIFVFGVAVGTAGTALLGLRSVKRVLATPPQAQPPAQLIERATARVAQQLSRDLELDDETEANIRAELRRAATAIRRLRVENYRALQTEVRSTATRISAQVPPEQRERVEARVIQHLRRVGLEPAPAQPPRPPGT
jgi:hypothetical protein